MKMQPKMQLKMQRKHWIMLGIALAVAVAALVWWLTRKPKPATRTIVVDQPGTGTRKLFADCPNDANFPLGYGSCGKKVEQLQMWLLRKYGARFDNFGVDGLWGEETEAVFKRFVNKADPVLTEAFYNAEKMGELRPAKFANA